MVEPTPFRRPIHWDNLRADEAERVIRERTKETTNIVISRHAFNRIDEREITQPDVYNILRTGFVEGSPQMNIEGDWDVTVTKLMPDGRYAGVVKIVFRKKEILFVKTVEWMDVKR